MKVPITKYNIIEDIKGSNGKFDAQIFRAVLLLERDTNGVISTLKEALRFLEKYKNKSVKLKSDLKFHPYDPIDEDFERASILRKGSRVRLIGHAEKEKINFSGRPRGEPRSRTKLELFHRLPPGLQALQIALKRMGDPYIPWVNDSYIIKDQNQNQIGASPLLELIYAVSPETFEVIESLLTLEVDILCESGIRLY